MGNAWKNRAPPWYRDRKRFRAGGTVIALKCSVCFGEGGLGSKGALRTGYKIDMA